MGPLARRLVAAAQETARRTRGFQRRLGAGAGDDATKRYKEALDNLVRRRWPDLILPEERVIEGARYRFDYYIPSERTVIEVALSARNPGSEFEKDAFKVLLAKRAGKPVDRLVVVGKEGTEKRLDQPGQRAICAFARAEHGIDVDVKDLK